MDNKLQKLDTLRNFLIEENSKYNLTRITDPEEIEIRHFQDSLVVMDMLTEYADTVKHQPSLIDIGSGAGFPGIVLAVMLENWKIVSVESTGKKAAFQKKAAEKLKLQNFEVKNRRAEDLAHNRSYREKFDIATARALGHLAVVTELAAGFLTIGGLFLAWKGPKVADEIEKTEKTLPKTGLRLVGEIPYTLGKGEKSLSDCRIIRLVKTKKTDPQYPRPYGVIKRNPAK